MSEKAKHLNEIFSRRSSENRQKKIDDILADIESLHEVEKLRLYLLLPTGAPSVSDSGAKAVLKNDVAFSHRWIRTHLQEEPDLCLSKNEVLEEYTQYCKAHGVRPASREDFGKLMKSVFPNVTSRRLGTRGQAKHCYGGLTTRTEFTGPALPLIRFEETDELSDNDELEKGASFPERRDLARASCALICEWAENLLQHSFSSIHDVAEHLIQHSYVRRNSEAAYIIMSQIQRFRTDNNVPNPPSTMDVTGSSSSTAAQSPRPSSAKQQLQQRLQRNRRLQQQKRKMQQQRSVISSGINEGSNQSASLQEHEASSESNFGNNSGQSSKDSSSRSGANSGGRSFSSSSSANQKPILPKPPTSIAPSPGHVTAKLIAQEPVISMTPQTPGGSSRIVLMSPLSQQQVLLISPVSGGGITSVASQVINTGKGSVNMPQKSVQLLPAEKGNTLNETVKGALSSKCDIININETMHVSNKVIENAMKPSSSKSFETSVCAMSKHKTLQEHSDVKLNLHTDLNQPSTSNTKISACIITGEDNFHQMKGNTVDTADLNESAKITDEVNLRSQSNESKPKRSLDINYQAEQYTMHSNHDQYPKLKGMIENDPCKETTLETGVSSGIDCDVEVNGPKVENQSHSKIVKSEITSLRPSINTNTEEIQNVSNTVSRDNEGIVQTDVTARKTPDVIDDRLPITGVPMSSTTETLSVTEGMLFEAEETLPSKDVTQEANSSAEGQVASNEGVPPVVVPISALANALGMGMMTTSDGTLPANLMETLNQQVLAALVHQQQTLTQLTPTKKTKTVSSLLREQRVKSTSPEAGALAGSCSSITTAPKSAYVNDSRPVAQILKELREKRRHGVVPNIVGYVGDTETNSAAQKLSFDSDALSGLSVRMANEANIMKKAQIKKESASRGSSPAHSPIAATPSRVTRTRASAKSRDASPAGSPATRSLKRAGTISRDSSPIGSPVGRAPARRSFSNSKAEARTRRVEAKRREARAAKHTTQIVNKHLNNNNEAVYVKQEPSIDQGLDTDAKFRVGQFTHPNEQSFSLEDILSSGGTGDINLHSGQSTAYNSTASNDSFDSSLTNNRSRHSSGDLSFRSRHSSGDPNSRQFPDLTRSNEPNLRPVGDQTCAASKNPNLTFLLSPESGPNAINKNVRLAQLLREREPDPNEQGTSQVSPSKIQYGVPQWGNPTDANTIRLQQYLNNPQDSSSVQSNAQQGLNMEGMNVNTSQFQPIHNVTEANIVSPIRPQAIAPGDQCNSSSSQSNQRLKFLLSEQTTCVNQSNSGTGQEYNPDLFQTSSQDANWSNGNSGFVPYNQKSSNPATKAMLDQQNFIPQSADSNAKTFADTGMDFNEGFASMENVRPPKRNLELSADQAWLAKRQRHRSDQSQNRLNRSRYGNTMPVMQPLMIPESKPLSAASSIESMPILSPQIPQESPFSPEVQSILANESWIGDNGGGGGSYRSMSVPAHSLMHQRVDFEDGGLEALLGQSSEQFSSQNYLIQQQQGQLQQQMQFQQLEQQQLEQRQIEQQQMEQQQIVQQQIEQQQMEQQRIEQQQMEQRHMKQQLEQQQMEMRRQQQLSSLATENQTHNQQQSQTFTQAPNQPPAQSHQHLRQLLNQQVQQPINQQINQVNPQVSHQFPMQQQFNQPLEQHNFQINSGNEASMLEAQLQTPVEQALSSHETNAFQQQQPQNSFQSSHQQHGQLADNLFDNNQPNMQQVETSPSFNPGQAQINSSRSIQDEGKKNLLRLLAKRLLGSANQESGPRGDHMISGASSLTHPGARETLARLLRSVSNLAANNAGGHGLSNMGGPVETGSASQSLVASAQNTPVPTPTHSQRTTPLHFNQSMDHIPTCMNGGNMQLNRSLDTSGSSMEGLTSGQDPLMNFYGTDEAENMTMLDQNSQLGVYL